MPGKTTIRTVAERAGISVGTVSRVLNEHPAVDREIREKVTRAIAELGYEPNLLARNMRRQSTLTIGCIIRDISIPALSNFVKAAQETLIEADYGLIVANSDAKADRERKLMRRFAQHQADGLILSLGSEVNTPDLQALARRRFPVVLLDRDGPDWTDRVLADHRTGTRRAVQHLLSLGHRRIALLTGDDAIYPSRARALGYHEAMDAAGVPMPERLLRSASFLQAFGQSETATLLTAPQRPTAVIAGGMDMLPGVLRAVRAAGLRIPQDISLVATSDTALGQLSQPSIAVVDWDLGELGRLAARLLLDRVHLQQNPSPRRIMISTEFLPRESCARPPT
jgi:LacI family transcriptional regulator, galactose operon repressor